MASLTMARRVLIVIFAIVEGLYGVEIFVVCRLILTPSLRENVLQILPDTDTALTYGFSVEFLFVYGK